MPVKCLGCYEQFGNWTELREHDCSAAEYQGAVWRKHLEPDTERVEVNVGGAR